MVKFLTSLLSPCLGIFTLLVAQFIMPKKWGKVFYRWSVSICLALLMIFGTRFVPEQMGMFLERCYPQLPLEKVPKADVIVVLGGGIGSAHEGYIFPELFSACDRVWHAARLYHAGKAPYIMPSGCSEIEGSDVFLKDFGVPIAAIIMETNAVNTIGNGMQVKALMQKENLKTALLVTSAYHMRRAEMIFQRLEVDVIPIATDHEALYAKNNRAVCVFSIMNLMPSGACLDRSATYCFASAGTGQTPEIG